jgi:hypothetical protein
MQRVTGILLAVSCFFAGIVLGFLIAPIKGGFGGFGNNSGNMTKFYMSGEDEEK